MDGRLNVNENVGSDGESAPVFVETRVCGFFFLPILLRDMSVKQSLRLCVHIYVYIYIYTYRFRKVVDEY